MSASVSILLRSGVALTLLTLAASQAQAQQTRGNGLRTATPTYVAQEKPPEPPAGSEAVTSTTGVRDPRPS